jgi:hypothetical protein
MRILAVLALAPALLCAAPHAAQACGDEEQVVLPRDDASTLISQAIELEQRAANADVEAAQAARRAKKLDAVARRLRAEAELDEGVVLANLLEEARNVSQQAAESRAHMKRAKRRAASFRAQAQALREQAADLGGGMMDHHKRMRIPRTSI